MKMHLFSLKGRTHYQSCCIWEAPGFPGGPDCEESAHNAGDLSGKDVPPPPEKRKAAHSGVCVRIPWTEGPGGLQPAGRQSDPTECAPETSLTGSDVVSCGPVSSVLVRFQPSLCFCEFKSFS